MALPTSFKRLWLLSNIVSYRRAFREHSDYYPLHRNIDLLKGQQNSIAQSRHIQPREGPARAFGDALRQVRKERGLSQEQLALDSGLDRTYISLVERGAQSPTIRTVIKLAGVLEVKPSDIVLRMEALMPKPRAAITKRRA
jgi:DNA-binding XRE family transcriptional regulator